MSVANPPIIVTSIYNPAFFEASAEDTITQAQANALYLKKKTADTATALETFSAGIATNSLATTTLASNLQIGSATNTGTIYISTIATNNSNADPAISIGANAGTKTIKINNGTNSVHCSSIDMLGSGINNVSNSTGNIDLANLQTSGVCNIATGARVLSGSGGSINIGTGSGAIVNPITIGGASSATSVGGTLGVTGVLTGTGNINTNSLGSIGGTLALGGLDIINLGTSSGRSAACSINTVGTGITSIAGNVGQTIRKFGATQGTDYQYDNTNLIVGTQNMALYSTQTSGRLDIGTGARVLTGQGGGINIGTGSGGIANPITVGGASSALTLNGGVISIGNSFSTTTLNGVISFANLAIDSVDRATAGTLSLGTSIANLVNISRSTIDTAILGTLSVAETTITTGLLTATGGLTMGTGKNITLQSTTGYVAPVSGGLGYRTSLTLSTTSAIGSSAGISGFPATLVTFTMPVGVYVFEAFAQINTVLTYDWTFGPTAGVTSNTAGSSCAAVNGTQRTTFVISNSTSALWYWGERATVTGGVYAFMSVYVTRIA